MIQKKYFTRRLQIDRIALKDATFIQTLVNEPAWLKYIGERNVHSPEDAGRFVQKVMDNPLAQYWVVTLKDNNLPIGLITLIKRDYLELPDLGFAFLADYAGKGYAHEAATVVLQDIQQSPALPLVYAVTVKNNASSIRLLQKLGFVLEREIEVSNEPLFLYARAKPLPTLY